MNDCHMGVCLCVCSPMYLCMCKASHHAIILDLNNGVASIFKDWGAVNKDFFSILLPFLNIYATQPSMWAMWILLAVMWHRNPETWTGPESIISPPNVVYKHSVWCSSRNASQQFKYMYRKGTSIRQAPVFRHLGALRKSPWKFIIWMNKL